MILDQSADWFSIVLGDDDDLVKREERPGSGWHQPIGGWNKTEKKKKDLLPPAFHAIDCFSSAVPLCYAALTRE